MVAELIASNPCDSRVSCLRQARDVLHRTAKTFNVHSEVPQRIDGDHPTVGIKGNHVGEHASKGNASTKSA